MTDIETKIRTKLDQLFIKAVPSNALTELKEELMADLMEFTNDNIKDGKSEDEAINAAFKQLGPVDELIEEINDDQASDEKVENDQTNDPFFKFGELEIDDSEVRIGKQTIIDGDRVNLGKFLQVDGNRVNMFNGFLDIDENHVHIGKFEAVDSFPSNLDMVNSKSFDVSNISEINIAYRSAIFMVRETSEDQLTINEYMSRDNERYYLQSNQYGDELDIREGVRPRLHWLKVRTEILVPHSFKGNLNLEARDGCVDVRNIKNEDLNLQLKARSGSVRMDTVLVNKATVLVSSGTLTADTVSAPNLTIDAKSGRVNLNYITGRLGLTAHSGALQMNHFAGTGDILVRSGSARLGIDQLIGKTNIEANSGSIRLDLDSQVNAKLEMSTDSGRVVVDRKVSLSSTGSAYAIGTIGDPDTQNVLRAKSHSGSIKLTAK